MISVNRQLETQEQGSFTEDVVEYLATDQSIVETARQVVAKRGDGPDVSIALLAAVLEAFSVFQKGTHPLVLKVFGRALCFEVDWKEVVDRLSSHTHEGT